MNLIIFFIAVKENAAMKGVLPSREMAGLNLVFGGEFDVFTVVYMNYRVRTLRFKFSPEYFVQCYHILM